MATYELKFDLLNFFSLQNNNKTLAVYVTGDVADIDKRWKQGETFTLGWFRKPMRDYTLTADGISGTTYGWSDSPVTSIRTHQEGGSDNQPYHYYDNFSVGSSGNADYRICLYFGLDSNNIPCLRILVYNVSTETYPYNGSNSYFNSPQKSDGLLYWSMGSGYLGGLSLNGTAVEGLHIPTSYGTTYACVCELCTDIPVFDTEAHAKAYCETLSSEGLLNRAGNPEEEYEEQFEYWYVKNKWGHNTRNTESNTNTTKNYRFYPKRKGICFIKHTPTASEPYDRILYHYSGYDAKYAAWGEEDDDDFVNNPSVTTHFLTKSISFGQNDYYTKFAYETNIPLWNNQQDADDYFNGLKDITEADNYAYISRQDNSILNPDLPGTNIDELTEVGTNGMRYSYGNRLYEITNVELSNLMAELFTPANFQDILDGNKLFGSNAMEAVSGVIYIPLTSLDAVCEMGSLAHVKIGSWESEDAQGRRIIKNEGTIDCGSFFYNRTYQDYRDYEPYNLLFVNLPFCGCHQLTISKYLDKTVSVKYNIDITTGGIVCTLYADNILVDVFEGTCGASRPISATDNNAYINNIVSAITGASSQAQGSITGISNAIGNVGKAVNVGALAAGGAALGAVGAAGVAGASGVYTAYQIKQAVDNPPQMHRGSLAGNLAYSLNTHPTFLFYTKRTIRPENELSLIGYPSGHGGVVGSFSGFLQCSAFKLANGFTGTEREREDILSIMRAGIYIE